MVKSTQLKCESIVRTLTKACCRHLDTLVLHCELKQQHYVRNTETEYRNGKGKYKTITHSVVYKDCWSLFWLEGWSEHLSSDQLCEQTAILTNCLHEVCPLKIPAPCMSTSTAYCHWAHPGNVPSAGKTGTTFHWALPSKERQLFPHCDLPSHTLLPAKLTSGQQIIRCELPCSW